eukprot:Gb_15995 [translate_table: standard]
MQQCHYAPVLVVQLHCLINISPSNRRTTTLRAPAVQWCGVSVTGFAALIGRIRIPCFDFPRTYLWAIHLAAVGPVGWLLWGAFWGIATPDSIIHLSATLVLSLKDHSDFSYALSAARDDATDRDAVFPRPLGDQVNLTHLVAAPFSRKVLSALKYATVFPVIFLSALKYHVVPEMWIQVYRPLWLLSSVINSCYSFYWDACRDWDFSIFTRNYKSKNPFLRPNLLYGHRWVYYWAVGSNLLLRCAWTYKLSSHLRHNYLTVFTMAALEMIRRFQWIFFRVENEWNKMSLKPNSEVPMKESSMEKETLLGTIERGV